MEVHEVWLHACMNIDPCLNDGGQHTLCIVRAQSPVYLRQALGVGPGQNSEPDVHLSKIVWLVGGHQTIRYVLLAICKSLLPDVLWISEGLALTS